MRKFFKNVIFDMHVFLKSILILQFFLCPVLESRDFFSSKNSIQAIEKFKKNMIFPKKEIISNIKRELEKYDDEIKKIKLKQAKGADLYTYNKNTLVLDKTFPANFINLNPSENYTIIASQSPYKCEEFSNIFKFWEIVDKEEVDLIICLDKDHSKYLSLKEKVTPVIYSQKDKNKNFEKHIVKNKCIIKVNSWSFNTTLTPAELLNLIILLEDNMKNKKILVHGNEGLYRTMQFIIAFAIKNGIDQKIITKENYLDKISKIIVNAFSQRCREIA